MNDTFQLHAHYELFLNYLSQFGTISTDEIIKIKTYCTVKYVKKKQILISENEACNKMFFVNYGMLRSYYRDSYGHKITRAIAIENSFISNMNSFRGLCENTETIECLEDAELLVANRINFSKLMDEFPNLKGIYSEILEVYDAMNIKRFHLMSLKSVKAKLNFFKEEYPHLTNKLTDSILASFLGISRESIVRNKKILLEF